MDSIFQSDSDPVKVHEFHEDGFTYRGLRATQQIEVVLLLLILLVSHVHTIGWSNTAENPPKSPDDCGRITTE